MKKLVMSLALLMTVVTTGVMLTACFGGIGSTPTREQLNGRWELTQIQTSGHATERAGTPLWTGHHFIDFDAEGNFSENDFWNNHFNASVTSHGTFTLNGSTLTMTRAGGQSLTYHFIGTRRVGISRDGDTLRIRYDRPAGAGFRPWSYTHTFTRVG